MFDKRSEAGGGLESVFAPRVEAFFRAAIAAQYPVERGQLHAMEVDRQGHQMFLDLRGENLLGRKKVERQVEVHLDADSTRPVVLSAEAGAGKSALMAACASAEIRRQEERRHLRQQESEQQEGDARSGQRPARQQHQPPGCSQV